MIVYITNLDLQYRSIFPSDADTLLSMLFVVEQIIDWNPNSEPQLRYRRQRSYNLVLAHKVMQNDSLHSSMCVVVTFFDTIW